MSSYSNGCQGRKFSYTRVSVLRMDTLEAAERIKYCEHKANVFLINTFRKITPQPRLDVPLHTECCKHTTRNGLKIGVVSVHSVKSNNGRDFSQGSLLTSRAKLQEAFSKCVDLGATIIATPMFGAESTDGNPPESVAEVLRSVITEFSGRVQRVVIASNNVSEIPFKTIASTLLGPQGVYGFDCESKSVEDVTGHFLDIKAYPHPVPPRQITTPVCEQGGFCENLRESHLRGCIHPPLCPYKYCTLMGSDYHRRLFWHKKECRYGCGCRDSSDYHKYFFSHSTQPSETKRSCKYAFGCTEACTADHSAKFLHSFLPMCPDAFACTDKDPKHLSTHCHVCPRGTKCSDQSPTHRKEAIHLEACKDGSTCSSTTDEHIDAFIHPKCGFVRGPCKLGVMCDDDTVEHRQACSHYKVDLHKCESKMLNVYDPTVGRSQKDKPFFFVDFDRNVAEWEAKLDAYFSSVGGIDTDSAKFKAVQEWVFVQLPNHMCSGSVFLSMIRTGTISSLEHLRSMWEKPKLLYENAAPLPHIAPLIEKINSDRAALMKYIKKFIVQCQFNKKAANASAIEQLAHDSTIYKVLCGTPPLVETKAKIMKEERATLLALDSEDDIKKVEEAYAEHVNHIYNLMMNIKGCQCKNDENVRTNYTPFSIYGPHNYCYGGAEVILVMSKEVTFHPDFYICPTAAYLYAAQAPRRAVHCTGTYPLDRTPWMGPNGTWEQHEKDYYNERFSPVASRWHIAAAKELVARSSVALKKGVKDITLDDVKTYWNGSNAHHLFESHLPYSVPLSYVRHIIITEKALKEVEASPYGKAAIDKWKKDYGDSFISSKGSNPQYVKKKSGKWPAKHPSSVADRPNGFCFVLDQKSRETFVPIKLCESKPSTCFSFMAKGGDFFFTVSSIPDYASEKEIRDVITFHVGKDGMGLSASLHPPLGAQGNPLKTDNDSRAARFNENCQHTPYVHYEVNLDYGRKTVAVYHYGPSRSYNACIFVVPMPASARRYSYISFCCMNDAADPVIWNLRQNACPAPRGMSAGNIHSHKDYTVNARVSREDVPKQEAPFCENPFTCSILMNERDPKHREHCHCFRHVCRKGESCRRKGDLLHRSAKAHMDKPLCPDKSCSLLHDPAHRMQFHHPGMWDYLVPCKYGDGCRIKGDDAHCKKYHHNSSYVYPDPSTLKYK